MNTDNEQQFLHACGQRNEQQKKCRLLTIRNETSTKNNNTKRREETEKKLPTIK